MKMNKWIKRISVSGLFLLLIGVLTGCGDNYIVLNPKGPVGELQANLMVISVILLGVVIVPVLIFFAYVVYKYRDKPGNNAPFKPKWDDSKTLETIWWVIPIILIAVLSFYTVRDTFALSESPSKDVKPMTIQVTSLDWKWLFLYPEEGIATVNYIKIPTDVPINFELTSDAPINSFWVPQLGGQKYTLPGTSLQLWLEASEPGTYFGTGANFTGEGFNDMKFNVIATSDQEFDQWVKDVKKAAPKLTNQDYKQLSIPGTAEKAQFSAYPSSLFTDIILKNGGANYSRNEELLKQAQ